VTIIITQFLPLLRKNVWVKMFPDNVIKNMQLKKKKNQNTKTKGEGEKNWKTNYN